MIRRLLSLSVLVLFLAPSVATADSLVFNGQPENQIDKYDYFYSITGGKFPTGNDPNGDNGSGGVFRYVSDDPYWGQPTGTWKKDDWFPQNAGLALTLQSGGATVYDNNGIEDGTYGDYYNAPAQGTADAATPGLYTAYNMRNNFDWAYASYFKLEQDTTFDTIIGYFNWDGYYNTFDPDNPYHRYYMNIWSTVAGQDCTLNGVGCMPANTGMFQGDVFSTDLMGGTFTWSYTDVDRVFNDGHTDPIGRLVFTLDQPFTLPAGEYFYNNGAAVPEPFTLSLLGLGLLGAGLRARRKR